MFVISYSVKYSGYDSVNLFKTCCNASAKFGRLCIKAFIWVPIEGKTKKRLVYKPKKISKEVVRDNHLGKL